MVGIPDGGESRAAKRQRADVMDEAMPDAAPAAQANGDDFSSWAVDDLMPLYYKRIFPHADFYKWLAYGNDGKHPEADPALFKRREFCFTLKDDIFVRYQSFKDGAELAAALCARLPAKIDIGPVYSADPQQRKTHPDGKFFPVSRELVFDIDITDYDDVRTCCSGGGICAACWPLMAVAVQILDEGLRQDFGFENILWVFSGRRGIHCWVCDTRARQLTDDQRGALAAYFAVYKGQEEGLAKMFLSAVDHPFVSRAYEVLAAAWQESILPRQELLEHQGHQDKILQYVPCEDTRQEIRDAWQKRGNVDSVTRWQMLQQICEENSKPRASDKPAVKSLKEEVAVAPRRVVLAYTYPRLDIEVSKKMNHLLKAPFCVHPKTGKVCVPMDPAAVADFDPSAVPTVSSLLNELNRPGKQGDGWKGTSLEPMMECFQQKFLKGLQAACHKEMTDRARGASVGLAW